MAGIEGIYGAVYFDTGWFVLIIRVVREGSKLCNQQFRTALRNVEIGENPMHAKASVVCFIECAVIELVFSLR